MRYERPAPVYRVTCERCGADPFVTERVADAEITNMLRHLRTAHPDVLQEPAVLSLADLLRLVSSGCGWRDLRGRDSRPHLQPAETQNWSRIGPGLPKTPVYTANLKWTMSRKGSLSFGAC